MTLQSVEEILLESPVGHELPQVAIGGGDDHGDDQTVRSDPSGSNSRSCSTRSSLACTDGAMTPISSSRIVAAVGEREAALLVGHGAGEGAAHVAEEL